MHGGMAWSLYHLTSFTSEITIQFQTYYRRPVIVLSSIWLIIKREHSRTFMKSLIVILIYLFFLEPVLVRLQSLRAQLLRKLLALFLLHISMHMVIFIRKEFFKRLGGMLRIQRFSMFLIMFSLEVTTV